MAREDRERWNARYRAGDHSASSPSAVLVALAEWVPTRGRALDVAGGAGANAVWLAGRGLDVTVTDISEVALALAVERAVARGIDLHVAALDLEVDPLPVGPWDMVLCCNYVQRDLIGRLAEGLGAGGRLLWIHPTTDNLERHARPGIRHLLRPGEAKSLVEAAGLRVCSSEEGWVGQGEGARCLARVVAERAAR